MDQPDVAIEWLSRAARARDYWLLNISVDPAFDRLGTHSEFDAILRATAVPDSNVVQNALYHA